MSLPAFTKSFRKAIQFWWIYALLGLLFIFTSFWILRTPATAYLTLSLIFSVSFLISGAAEIVYAFANKNNLDNWGWTLFGGATEAIIGLILITKPGITMLLLPILVGFAIMFRSFVAMGIAFDLRTYQVSGWAWLLLLGISGFIFSAVMIWNPELGRLTIILWTALAFLTIGIFRLALALKLRTVHRKIGKFDK